MPEPQHHDVKPEQIDATAEALPAPGIYEIDPPHSFAYFRARHVVVGAVRGRFDKIAGTITVAQDPADCSLEVSIDVSSISTQNSMRDEDLRGAAFFDVKKFPVMTYHGRGIRSVSGKLWTMDGSLTVRGMTKTVPLHFTFSARLPLIRASRRAWPLMVQQQRSAPKSA